MDFTLLACSARKRQVSFMAGHGEKIKELLLGPINTGRLELIKFNHLGGVSIGVVLGYSVTGLMIAYLKEVHPTDPFKLQVLLLCAPVLAFFFVPGRYINVNKRKSPKHNDGDDHDNDLSYDYSDHTEEMEGPSERSPLLANIAEESTSTLTD
eukprot:Awhi_evm1s4691